MGGKARNVPGFPVYTSLLSNLSGYFLYFLFFFPLFIFFPPSYMCMQQRCPKSPANKTFPEFLNRFGVMVLVLFCLFPFVKLVASFYFIFFLLPLERFPPCTLLKGGRGAGGGGAGIVLIVTSPELVPFQLFTSQHVELLCFLPICHRIGSSLTLLLTGIVFGAGLIFFKFFFPLFNLF